MDRKSNVSSVRCCLNNHLSGNKAAALHGVPTSTLKVRLSGHVINGRKPGHKPYLTINRRKRNLQITWC